MVVGFEEFSSVGGFSSSCSDLIFFGELLSLDFLELFFNLYFFFSSCEFNSEEGVENRVFEEEEGVVVLFGVVFLCKGEEEEEEIVQVLVVFKECFLGQFVYYIKWIQWKEENIFIIIQNENGFCFLLVIFNVLFLVWKVKFLLMMEIIIVEQLMEYLGDYMFDVKLKEILEI